MRKLIVVTGIIALIATGAFSSRASAEQSFAIAAVVNEDAVSASDVYDRMKLIIASSGLQNSKEIRDKIMPQVLNSLVEEQLQMQEAARNDIVISKEEIEEGMQAVASQNNIDADQFRTLLERQGISVKTLERQIESQIAWSKVIGKVIRPQIQINQRDVEDRLSRLSSNIGKSEYLVSEIFLPIDQSSDESEIQALAQKLISEINEKHAPFETVAAQFSKAPGAEKGGDLGWVQEGQLAEELDSTLKTLPEGSVSNPIRGLSGYHILQLRQKRLLNQENLPTRDDITNQIGFERLEKMQRRLLQDLKAAAYIDRRV